MIVLIVEDEPSLAYAWRLAMEPVACELRMACDMREAIEQMRKLPPPDLVLLDLRLPGSSAEATVERIRDLKAINEEAVVIVITGAVEDNLPMLARHFGADAFEHKRDIVTQGRLLTAVKNALSKHTDVPIFAEKLKLFEGLSELCQL